MGTALAAAAIAVILFFGVLFWTSAPRAVAGLADAGRTAVSVVKEPSKQAQAATVDRVEDVAAHVDDAASRAGDATVQAIIEASEPVRATATQTAQDASEAAPRSDTVDEAAAEQIESVDEAVREATAEVTPDAVKDTAADKLQQAAEKLAQAAEKLEALAARIELTASPSEAADAPEGEPDSAARPESDEARRPGQGAAEARSARPAATTSSTTTTAASSTAGRTAASGRPPWVLMPRPEPAARVAPGALVVEARGRGDAPIARIRLVLDGTPLPVSLEQRGDAVWRAQAATRVAAGRHVVDAVVVDAEGRTGSYRWQFTAAP